MKTKQMHIDEKNVANRTQVTCALVPGVHVCACTENGNGDVVKSRCRQRKDRQVKTIHPVWHVWVVAAQNTRFVRDDTSRARRAHVPTGWLSVRRDRVAEK